MTALLLTGCGMHSQSVWETRTALEAPDSKLGGCAAGDLMAEHEGTEIAVVAADGSVYVIRSARTPEAGWLHERAWQGPGEMVQCAIGDADPRLPGKEFVGVGMRDGEEESGGAGAVYLIARRDGAWTARRIHEENSLVHGVAVVDGSAWVAGFDRKLRCLRSTEDETAPWRVDVELDLPGPGKNVLALGPKRIAVACSDGSLVLAAIGADGKWGLELLHRREAGRARLATDGARILCADDDGQMFLIRPREQGPRRATRLYGESEKMRGAVLADLEPTREGIEAASAGYAGTVSLLVEPRSGKVGDTEWQARPLLLDADRLHHLIAAEVDGHAGLELVACGYAGKVFVISRVTTDQRRGR